MKTTWERLENSRAKFEVEVPVEVVNQALERAYRKVVKKVNIPGFRKGKAPRFMVERYAGKGALMEEALDEVLPVAYNQAVSESGLSPVDRPQIDLVKLEDDQPLVFTAEVTVRPEVKLGQYKDLEIERENPEVTDDEVDRQLEAMAVRQAQLIAHDGPAEKGHFVVIDFEGFVDDQAFPGGKAEGYTLELGSGSFIPGFEDGLIGALTGEEREVKVKFPDDYQADHLAGKDAVFNCRVNEVKRKEIPPVDDELAKAAGDFKSLQELRSDLTNRLKMAAEDAAQRAFENRILSKLLETSEVEVPNVMIDRRVHRMIDEFGDRLGAQGMKIDDFMARTGKTYEDMHKEFAEPAARAVKSDLILEAVARAESLVVAEEDVKAEVNRLAQYYGDQAQAFREYLTSPDNLARLREALLRDKAVKHLAALQKPIELKAPAGAGAVDAGTGGDAGDPVEVQG